MKNMPKKEVVQVSQHSFANGILCHTNEAAFFDRMTALVDNGRATDIVYFDLCMAFDTVPYHIPTAKLERDRFEDGQ